MSNNYLSTISHLAVEGVIGVGKTSFCNILSTKMNAKLILEEVEENPFIQGFYKDKNRYAFQAQLFFLLSRYRQLSEIQQEELFTDITITDYIFEKDNLFATLNLNEKEMVLYNQIAGKLKSDLVKPDFVIYLQCSTERLLENIKIRGREYESNIDPNYIDELNNIYNDFFLHYSETPLLIIDATYTDFVNKSEDLSELINEIEKGSKGTRFYRPSAGSLV